MTAALRAGRSAGPSHLHQLAQDAPSCDCVLPKSLSAELFVETACPSR